ncbi:hypothetical protein L6R50_25340 [Myxococcota bacterium]|nr:hypothetical protein [Myxococcota bacterium]
MMPCRPPLLLLGLLLAGVACTVVPTGGGGRDDDDGDDDDAADDDAADDDGTGDDDDATGTVVEVLSPADGAEVGGFVEIEVETSEDVSEVAVVFSGEEVARADVASGRATLGWDSGMVQDGQTEVRVRDPHTGTRDDVVWEVRNDDLVTYRVGTVDNGPSGTPALYPYHSGALVSITYTIFGSRSDSYYLSVVRDASGTSLVDSDGDPYNDPIQVYATESPFTALIPNTPEVGLPEGEWTVFPVNTGETGTAELWAQVKRDWEGARAGILDVVCYFVSGSGLTASQAQTSSSFGTMLSNVESILSQASVALGDVSYRDVSTSSYSTVSSYDEFHDLLRETTDQGRALNLVFVSRFNSEFEGVLGVAGGIPGPAAFHGEGSSGVVIALSGTDWGTLAVTTAHESAHYLGLFHPVETVAGYYDPLPDTAECTYPCNGNGITGNLMWPVNYGGQALTSDQEWVLLRHPLVRLVDPSDLSLAVTAGGDPRIPPPPGGAAPACGSDRLRELREVRERAAP